MAVLERLGYGNTNNIGDGPNEMGDNLAAIDLGNGTAVQLAAGPVDTCLCFAERRNYQVLG